uniref:Uncharacterized protein n=1 Tax=Chromera velia CCMP2878 TaxID=1169474 RepID=A0A0G4HR46_9ALVE|mmetsp:Transcript_8515/g.16633  ORF Transcript_8515/g.16633 Transcript_8515/m.16633 type:complete len:582 (+) Transcript_8515:104-1849(+)|eukprot:Cvel_8038.t1-p1 / transcript=Cvel_8038.t1 / gene=Cvel_8038 / organism=Chromera_velia_CCMP2878 / gene_product=Ankyrin-3, putative / transcript_product=Ankyrin-3, putative / location=Cvel_scaffold434:86253-88102(-) / protein_length=581 / sequence_SO=supercontig / SO=protein_coding / is_pseudo=false
MKLEVRFLLIWVVGVATAQDNPSTSECTDLEGFVDVDGDGCDVYQSIPTLCDIASTFQNADGVDATTACCVCQQPEPEIPSLLTFVQEGDAEAVQNLLENGTSPDLQGPHGNRPLVLAARFNHTDVAAVLLDAGADVNSTDGGFATALHMAARLGNPEMVELLLENDADVKSSPAPYFYTPLHQAAVGNTSGHVESASLLVESGANVSARALLYHTPLHIAAMGGSLEMARLLVDEGADVNATNVILHSPLHMSLGGNDNLTAFFLEKGSDLEAKTLAGHTPLSFAIYSAAPNSTLQLLLDAGADTMSRDQFSDTPLHIAAQQNNTDAIRLLVREAGVPVDVRSDRSLANSSLITPDNTTDAGTTGNVRLEVVSSFVFQQTPLHMATGRSNIEAIDVLLDLGADINAVDEHQNTPIHVAAQRDSPAVITRLIARGASPNARGSAGVTPLMHAVMSGSDGVVEAFLENGANVNAETDVGLTALDLANVFQTAESTQIRTRLQSAGATVGSASSAGGSWGGSSGSSSRRPRRRRGRFGGRTRVGGFRGRRLGSKMLPAVSADAEKEVEGFDHTDLMLLMHQTE